MLTPQETPPTLIRSKGKGAKSFPPPPPILDDFDQEDEDFYFATYKPLSNLPTPPPSSCNPSFDSTSQLPFDETESLDDKLLGPASHLANLVPPAASLSTPSVPAVQAILSRAALPIDSIALAACILDSLNRRFAMSWRLSCPLAPAPSVRPAVNKRHTLPPNAHTTLNGYAPHGEPEPDLHIDSVFPEVIILAALIIASKFVEDSQEATSWYANAWGRGLWTCPQINQTERCIMENLNYRILPLWNREIIDDAIRTMELAGRFALRRHERSKSHASEKKQLKLAKSHHESAKSCGNIASVMHIPSETEKCSWA